MNWGGLNSTPNHGKERQYETDGQIVAWLGGEHNDKRLNESGWG